MLLTHQKESATNLQNSIQRSYTTLPGNQRGGQSYSPKGSLSPGRMPLLSTYSSKKPYEQQLVVQLIDAYRRDNHRPIQHTHERHSSQVRERQFKIPKIPGIQTGCTSEGFFARQPLDYDAYSNGGIRGKSEIPFGVGASKKSSKDNDTESSNLSILGGKPDRSHSNFPLNINGQITSNPMIL